MTGIYPAAELRHLTNRQLSTTLAAGELRRLARGWYADRTAPAALARAIERGGRLGCLNGAAHHGAWVPPTNDLHVAVRLGDPLPSPKPGVQFHRDRAAGWPGIVYPIVDCLDHIVGNHDPETALMVIESAHHLGLVGTADVGTLIAQATVRAQRTLKYFRPGAASGGETRVRVFFARHQVRVRTQVRIASVGTVDLLVGRSLICEVDGRAYHDTPSQFAYDRRRDLAAAALGFERIRLSYDQVFHDWPATRRSLEHMLALGCHNRWPDPDAILGWRG